MCQPAGGGKTFNVPSAAIALLVLLLVVLVIAASVAIHAPLMALPLVFLILFLWGGQRVASARGRTG